MSPCLPHRWVLECATSPLAPLLTPSPAASTHYLQAQYRTTGGSRVVRINKGHLVHVGRVSRVACGVWCLVESPGGAPGDEGERAGEGAKTQGMGYDLLRQKTKSSSRRSSEHQRRKTKSRRQTIQSEKQGGGGRHTPAGKRKGGKGWTRGRTG